MSLKLAPRAWVAPVLLPVFLSGFLSGLSIVASGCSFLGDDSPWAEPPLAPFTVTAATLSAPLGDPQPLNPTLTLSFSDFPDPLTVQYPALRLGPRGFAVEYLVETRLVERQLVLRPRAGLLPENDYFLDAATTLRSLSGQALPAPYRLQFRTGRSLLPTPPTEQPLVLADILGAAAGLRARCALAGCHARSGELGPAHGLDLSGSPEAVRAQLGQLAGSLARSGPLPAPPPEALLLVQPGAPEKSYLLRKLLAHRGYTRTLGAPMPPGGPLDEAALRAVQDWIRQGAR